MTDFVLVPSGYEQVIATVSASAPEFIQSSEFATIEGYGDDVPYVFIAAFAHFLERSGTQDRALLARGLDALDRLARFDEQMIDELLDDAVFENLLGAAAPDRALLAAFPPRLRAKADRWCGRRS